MLAKKRVVQCFALLCLSLHTSPSQKGSIGAWLGDESELFSDYKDFGGWLMPTRAAHKSADGTQVETITSVSFDDVPDSVFTLPDAIKSVLTKKDRG